MKLVDLGHRAFPSVGAPQKLKVGRKESPVATITYTPSGTSAPANAYVVVVGIAEKRYRQHIRAMLVDDSRRRAGAIVSNIISEELKVPEGVNSECSMAVVVSYVYIGSKRRSVALARRKWENCFCQLCKWLSMEMGNHFLRQDQVAAAMCLASCIGSRQMWDTLKFGVVDPGCFVAGRPCSL